MDWLELKAQYPAPAGQPPRCAELLALRRVLDGTQYDDLPNPFSREKSGAGEYIPLSKRRPSVRSNLCSAVVDESTSLLFGDTHWPTIKADHSDTADALACFVRESDLPALMLDAARRGSIGSVALLVEAVERALRVSVLDTAYLTPTWDDATRELTRVVERYMLTGQQLAEAGFEIPPDSMQVKFWWRREWDDQAVAVYVPQPVTEDAPEPVIDATHSVTHGLGFVPIVWIRNLAPASQVGEPDGPCTFGRAIDTVIEADYLLSQGSRALKYMSDPVLVLKSGGEPGGAAHQGGSASALNLPPEGDAKLLEINGAASGALLEMYRELRALVLEQLHGNRAHADKLSAAQSGRAMEMMCQSLIWLADRLRQSYGDGGLLPLLKMACRFSSVLTDGVRIGGTDRRSLDPAGLDLHWPDWFPPTTPELLTLAQGLVTAVDGNILSNETAVQIYAARAGVPDGAEEWQRVSAQIRDAEAKAAQAAAAAKASDDRKAAIAGNTLSHQVEA